jgi:two-component system phosphate regulon sensor histidine kinase PhoR
MATLIGPLNEGVILLDKELTVLAVNPAAAAIAGRPIESMIRVSLIQAVRDYHLVELARDASGQRAALHLSGPERDVVATATSVESGDARVLMCIEDVTALLRARRARSELVANVSHELRTPIAAARALAETLQAGVDEPDGRDRFLARLAEELERLGNIVQRLLRLARLESGAETFAVEVLDAHALLDQAASRMAPLAEQRHIQVEVVPADDGGLYVHADRERTLEVLSNLLDNAVRHSPDGATVELRVRPDGGLVRFEVADHGPGIPPVDRERIFERFYTGDRSRTPGAGSGLGLAIARHIVQQLGGRIWVADRAIPGAAICFTLPAALESSERTGRPSDDRGDGRPRS